MDANMRGDNEARTANMVQFFQPHIKNMDSEARSSKKQIFFMLTVKDIEAYHHAVRNAHDPYQRRMDELTTEWNLLSSTFDLFKPQADASLRRVLSSLPMVDLRATYNLDGEFTIKVITFVKVEQLRSYIEDISDIKIEQEESTRGVGDATPQVSVAQLQEKIASLEGRVEELERVVRRTRDDDEAHDPRPPENVPTQAVESAHTASLPSNVAAITQDAFNRLFDQRCTQVFGHGVHQIYDQVLLQVTTGSLPRNILQLYPSLTRSTEVSAIERATGVEKPVSPSAISTPARSNDTSGLEEHLHAQATNNSGADTAIQARDDLDKHSHDTIQHTFMNNSTRSEGCHDSQ